MCDGQVSTSFGHTVYIYEGFNNNVIKIINNGQFICDQAAETTHNQTL